MMNMKKIILWSLFLFTLSVNAYDFTACLQDEEENPLVGKSVILSSRSGVFTTDVNGMFTIEGVEESDTLKIPYKDIYMPIPLDGMKRATFTIGAKISIDEYVNEPAVASASVKGIDGEQVEATIDVLPNVQVNVYTGGQINEVAIDTLSSAIQILCPDVVYNAAQKLSVKGSDYPGANALLVVNGMPKESLDVIDIASVRRVEVLNDAASYDAIYREKGFAGVIIVISK